MFLTKLFRKLKPLPHWRCLTCEHFCWWDGDYCCLDHGKIFVKSPSGRITKEQYDTLYNKYKQCWSYSEKLDRRNKDGLYIPLDKLIRK